MITTIRKAVIPAAGLGTRWLPATKCVAKELLPLAGKPLIQHAVEEAVASGIEKILLVSAPGKRDLERYFQRDPVLEERVHARGDGHAWEELARLQNRVELQVAIQEQPRGLADAVACARSFVGDEPFAVLLPDNLVISDTPCTRQLIECYSRSPGCIVAIREVGRETAGGCGMVLPAENKGQQQKLFAVASLLEKPAAAPACWRYAIFGRYVLEPGIFEVIGHTRPGAGGELQLTDSLDLYATSGRVWALRFEGEAYDAGSKLDFLRASLAVGLRDSELGPGLRSFVRSLQVNSLC
jgi:UTP--glucose-1-phosphate uridylyltransferase